MTELLVLLLTIGVGAIVIVGAFIAGIWFVVNVLTKAVKKLFGKGD